MAGVSVERSKFEADSGSRASMLIVLQLIFAIVIISSSQTDFLSPMYVVAIPEAAILVEVELWLGTLEHCPTLETLVLASMQRL